jgi:hypothetical protein
MKPPPTNLSVKIIHPKTFHETSSYKFICKNYSSEDVS